MPTNGSLLITFSCSCCSGEGPFDPCLENKPNLGREALGNKPLFLRGRGGVAGSSTGLLNSQRQPCIPGVHSSTHHGMLFRAEAVTIFPHHLLQELAEGVEPPCAVS